MTKILFQLERVSFPSNHSRITTGLELDSVSYKTFQGITLSSRSFQIIQGFEGLRADSRLFKSFQGYSRGVVYVDLKWLSRCFRGVSGGFSMFLSSFVGIQGSLWEDLKGFQDISGGV